MAKKARTKAQRSAAAKKAWQLRKLKAAKAPTPVVGSIAATTQNFNVPGYEKLARELVAAYEQSSVGKGKVRHANGLPFDRQPIAEIGRIVGPAFNTGQAMKKTGEATQMFARGEVDAAIHELHGAIVYLASAIMRMRGE